MLPAAARLRRREDFTTVVRRGRRVTRGPLVVHLHATLGNASSSARAGFVIPKTVGNAVVRNRLRRRLRHLLPAHLARLAPESGLVVRALPGSGELDSVELGSLLASALEGGR